MGVVFGRIKKYSKASNDIDEKLKCLNKELKKTGLQELSIANVYQDVTKQPNQNVVDFEAISVNGYGLGLSPADGNGLGDAYIGEIESGMRGAGANEIGMTGVAISPPHPVTGQRQVATTRTGMVDFSPARPGVDQTGNGYPTGSIAWIWDPNYPQFGTNGLWRQIQLNVVSGKWGFWDDNFLGFGFLNTNLDQMEFSDGSNLDADTIEDLLPLGIVGMGGGLGPPETTVIGRVDFDDPDYLPINIPDLSKQAFDYIKDKAKGFFDKVRDFGDTVRREIESRTDAVTGIVDGIPPFLGFLAHQVNDNSPWTPENPFPVNLDDKQTEGMKNDIEQVFDNWGSDRVDEINNGSPMTDQEMKDINNKINAQKGDKSNDALDAKYPSSRFTINNIGNPNAFEGNIKTNKDGSKTPTAIEDNYVFEGDADASVPLGPEIIKTMIDNEKVQNAIKKSDLKYPYRKDDEIDFDAIVGGADTPTIFNKNMPIKVDLTTRSSFKESLNENVILKNIDSKILNVDIEQLRRKIKPEFPKNAPPAIIGGYSANSRLAPKDIKGSPFIKVTKKDLARNHKLTDKEIKDFMSDINMINDYIKDNPDELKYAMIRYPKDDPRLAQLNFKLDQMKAASDEYMDTLYPKNEKLFNKLKKRIKHNIDQTDPKNFKGVKLPKFDNIHLEELKKKKEIYSKYLKKPVNIQKSRLRRHISAKDLRETLTLRFRDELNPVFWEGKFLKPVVRNALMRFGKSFAEYVDLPEESIIDIILLGGNAGYNYTRYSDLDVHLVINPSYVPDCDPEFIDDYYKDKKTLWELTHDVKIFGVKAEPYIERPNIVRKKSQGVYSILKNKWLQEPEKADVGIDEKELEKKVNNAKNILDRLLQSNNAVGLKAAVKKLRDARTASIEKFGEYGMENLVFKELRNAGYIDKVRKVGLELKSKSLSL